MSSVAFEPLPGEVMPGRNAIKLASHVVILDGFSANHSIQLISERTGPTMASVCL
jgi:hypothetical protein